MPFWQMDNFGYAHVAGIREDGWQKVVSHSVRTALGKNVPSYDC